MAFDLTVALWIAAAVDGLGVVLESKLLAEREIASGKLVCPLVNSTTKYIISVIIWFPPAPTHAFCADVFKPRY